MNLYELNEVTTELEQAFEDGEITEQCLADTIESIGGTLEEKTENIVKYIRSREADAKMLKEEAKHFTDRARVATNKVDRLKAYLKQFMIDTDTKSINAGIFDVKLAKGRQSLDVQSLINIPSEYLVMQAPRVDKRSLLEYINNGNDVDGVEVKATPSLRIK